MIAIVTRLPRPLCAFALATTLALVPHGNPAVAPSIPQSEAIILRHDTGATHGPPYVKVASRSNPPDPPAPRPIYAGLATITAYTACDDAGMRCDGIAANGSPARAWTTVAAWSAIPFGSRVEVTMADGSIRGFTVEDRGGAIGYGKLDVYIGAGEGARRQAMEFGRQRLNVKIYSP